MKQINKILIANRGEISSRISRTCKKMGIASVAVYSDADRNAPFVSDAGEAVFIGENAPALSYLNQDKIIEAAKRTGADAIHPGYGFLSENAGFAKRCADEGIIFIAPHPEAIMQMGSKSNAKAIMQKHNVPTVPGYQGKDQSIEKLVKEANNIGFPLLLKAAAGGGGKGMRIVNEAKEVQQAIEAARRESLSAFGDEELIIEKYIASGRHIEFQIFGDKHGNAIHILERECTIQRRYQKVFEESPSPVMTSELRKKMGSAAVSAAKALNYDNAGTVEFIYDDSSGEFYFLEVNTRLQVEHPVTEEITGLDLVKMQIESAQGKPLSINQEDVKGTGYAIETRLYAEDPDNDFLPVTGTVEKFIYPEVDGLRVETAVVSGSVISVFYDPMIAKIIVWDKTREDAHRKMRYALKNMICQGTKTNQQFLISVLENQKFNSGKYNTHFIKENLTVLLGKTQSVEITDLSLLMASYTGWTKRNAERTLLKTIPNGWRNNFYAPNKEKYFIGKNEYSIGYYHSKGMLNYSIDNREYSVKILDSANDKYSFEVNGIRQVFTANISENKIHIHHHETGNVTIVAQDRLPLKEKEKIAGGYEAPMPSQIIRLLVQSGAEVKQGEGLIVLSSMKMENTIVASCSGKVEEIYVAEGTNVEAGTLLLKIKEN